MWELSEIMSERHLAWYHSYSKISIRAAVIIITQYGSLQLLRQTTISFLWYMIMLSGYTFSFIDLPLFFARNSLSFPDTNPFVVLYIWPLGLPRWLSGKEAFCNTGDTGDVDLIPGSGRSPREGNGNPLQYLSRDNPKNRRAWWATVHGVANCQT